MYFTAAFTNGLMRARCLHRSARVLCSRRGCRGMLVASEEERDLQSRKEKLQGRLRNEIRDTQRAGMGEGTRIERTGATRETRRNVRSKDRRSSSRALAGR